MAREEPALGTLVILALKVLQKTRHKVPLRLSFPSPPPQSPFDFDPLLFLVSFELLKKAL